MDQKSVDNMKMDRRLIERRGWISEKDLQRELAALPDVSDKVAPDDPDSESSSDIAAAGAAASTQTESVSQSEPSANGVTPEPGSGAAIGSPPADVAGPSGPKGSDSPLT